jgi:protease YdgD
VAVFGKDERTDLPQSHQSLGQAVGLLYSRRARTLCSAFCVGDDIIATAAHCFFRTAQDPFPAISDFVFRSDSRRGGKQSRLAGQRAATKAQFVLAGSMRLSVRPPIEASRDWALARLDQPICRGHVLRLKPMPSVEISQHAHEGRMFQVAHHRDWHSGRLAFSRGCTVQHKDNTAQWDGIARDFIDAESLILHTCDTGGASSGSPLFVETPGGPVVVGINVGTYVQSKIALRGGSVVRRYRARDIANTGVNIIALADKLGAFSRAPILASRTHIRSLQSQLKSRAVYLGSLDGTYGPKLRAAIESYERTHNLPVTGLATQTLLRRLSDSRAPALPVTTGSLRDDVDIALPIRPQRRMPGGQHPNGAR